MYPTTMQHKIDVWMFKHNVLLEAASVPVTPDDTFQELLKMVQAHYVRLSDRETLALHELASTGTPDQQTYAHDALAHNALPLVLETAYEYSTRFGSLLEAWDGALHLLNRLLPRQTETSDSRIRKSGWNPHLSGIRWLSWVMYKLPAEMPTAAERLVDEKRASGAPAVIAAARNRLLYGVGNDASLHDEFLWQRPRKLRLEAALPKGRKNVIVKKGKQRFTQAVLIACRIATTPQKMSASTVFVKAHSLPEFQPTQVPISADWIARAVRANARALLARPNLAERTQREAQLLLHANEEWVNRNAKAHRLDEVVGEEGTQRLTDIIAAHEPDDVRFEAPLHRTDIVRALNAYRRYGPVHGDALMKLPVRELLPVYRKRLKERQVRDAFQGFLTRAGLSTRGHEVIQAARSALQLTDTDPNASVPDLKDALRGLQSALRGQRSTTPTGKLGTLLSQALVGTALQPTNPADIRHAQALRKAFPTLPLTFPLVAALVFGRKLDRQGDADRRFVAACRKAGVRIRVAEDALSRLHDVPVTEKKGTRIRVQTGKGYLRPMQLALEAAALRIGAQADLARPYIQVVEQDLANAERQAMDVDSDHWLDAMDVVAEARLRQRRAVHISDTLNVCTAVLEESCTDLKLGRALLALVDADELLADYDAIQNHQEWWADAYWALKAAPTVPATPISAC
ncbi:hypothetical protein [Deinococcus ruber]|uniref:Uncharacterized protein n=1 Tax=Deinococcus ruber TaxID=1848197 RepID=A0A918C952_9DEIO|nr:hypothetical protein [Deinococcus ruber]GGR12810.1 hypothetical protein GCM10008957_27190 [Deinococcus ruber]